MAHAHHGTSMRAGGATMPCVCMSRRALRVVCRYGSVDQDRWVLGKTIKTMQLEQEEAQLPKDVPELRSRLDLLGENTLGINSPVHLRKLLALRLHALKAKATRFPLRRSAGKHKGSKSYLLVPVDVDDLGIVDFLIDTGTTGTLITAEMRDELGLSPLSGKAAKGLDSLGVTLRQKVSLPALRLGPFKLHSPDGFVIDYKLSGGDNIGGVLGVNFLSSFDVELHPEPPGYIAFHPTGHISRGVIRTDNCAELSCTTTKGGLIAVKVSLNGCPPFPGIIDLGASVSTMNSAAAKAAEKAGGNLYVDKVNTSDGSVNMVLRSGVQVTLGDPEMGEHYQPSHEVTPLLIRDVPIFSVLGFQDQPGMILGKDIVGEGRTLLQLSHRRIWLQR